MPLCARCRDAHVNRPYPPAILISMVAIAAVFIFAMFLFPASIRADIAFERGQRAEGARNYNLAVIQYRKVVATFPDAVEPTARLGISYYKAGDSVDAAKTLLLLQNREVSKDLQDELDGVVKDMQKNAPQNKQEAE